MKKLFISQPMRGKTKEEIEETRQRAIESATAHIKEEYGQDEEVEVINSFVDSSLVQKDCVMSLWMLGAALQKLSMADVAYFCKGYEDSRGCRVENLAAVDYGIELVIEDYR